MEKLKEGVYGEYLNDRSKDYMIRRLTKLTPELAVALVNAAGIPMVIAWDKRGLLPGLNTDKSVSKWTNKGYYVIQHDLDDDTFLVVYNHDGIYGLYELTEKI